jgi:tetratricopeptide (TPR) repeat protein
MRAAVIAIALCAAILPAHASPTRDLDDARQGFKGGDWQSARRILKDLLYPPPGQLASTSDLIDAHLLLGLCHYELGNRDEAKMEFEAVLALQPDKTLDDLLFNKGAVRLFDEARADIDARRQRDVKLRELEEEKERLRKFRDSLVVYEARPYYINFLPFGAGQLQNKQNVKAALLGGGQILSFVTSVGVFLYLAGEYGLVAKVPLEDGPRVLRLQQIEVATGAAFFVLYGIGVYDALRNYKANVRVKGDDSLIPPELRDPEKPPPKPRKKTSLRDRLRIAPMLSPTGVGIGIGWETD